jgi:hypothetical protein
MGVLIISLLKKRISISIILGAFCTVRILPIAVSIPNICCNVCAAVNNVCTIITWFKKSGCCVLPHAAVMYMFDERVMQPTFFSIFFFCLR